MLPKFRKLQYVKKNFTLSIFFSWCNVIQKNKKMSPQQKDHCIKNTVPVEVLRCFAR